MTRSYPLARLGIIGTGRVAHALALALAPQTQHQIRIWGRSPQSAQIMHSWLAAQPVTTASVTTAASPAELYKQSDVILLAVSDDALDSIITEIAAQLATRPETTPHLPLIFHVSGRSGAGLLAPLYAHGAVTAAIHPAMTFTGNAAEEVARMIGAPFAITAPDANGNERAEQLVLSIGGTPFRIAEDKRILYHAALSHAANHLVTLQAGAAAMLDAAGVDAPYTVLRPLVQAALDNTLARGFAALSGPLLRGDAGTVALHLAAIAAASPPNLAPYRAMAMATLAQLEDSADAGTRDDSALHALLARPTT